MKIEQIKIKYTTEIRRLEDAIRRTSSERLRRDYGKAVRHMRKELRDYDKFRNTRIGV